MKKLIKTAVVTTVIAGIAGIVLMEGYLWCEEELSRKEKKKWLQSQSE